MRVEIRHDASAEKGKDIDDDSVSEEGSAMSPSRSTDALSNRRGNRRFSFTTRPDVYDSNGARPSRRQTFDDAYSKSLSTDGSLADSETPKRQVIVGGLGVVGRWSSHSEDDSTYGGPIRPMLHRACVSGSATLNND